VSSSFAAAFADMARLMHQEPDVEQTVDRVAELAKQSLACDCAGVMLVHGGKQVETAATTDALVEKADKLQMECRQGPCLEAIWDHGTFVIDDTTTERRWPEWCRQVAGLGVRSVLSLRLFTHNNTLGALNLYSVEPGRFDEDDVAVAAIFAGHASVALAAARNESSLRQAIDARHLIGQAQGILMERFNLDADQAFSILRRYSQDKNVKLRTVAEEMVSSRRLPA
jgi:GAF domain-containing protein